MKKIFEKIFGNIDMSWKKLVIFAVITAVYTAVLNQIPILQNTSFTDIAVTMEVWVFFGIIIICNSKSPKDSALKCFVFFLISQPLIYLLEVPTKGFEIFRYYDYWFKWTILTLPMGYIGYYIKKDKIWGVCILLPVIALVNITGATYLKSVIFSFPRHILTYVFCTATSIIYCEYIFKNKKAKLICYIFTICLVLASIIYTICYPKVYSPLLMFSGDKLNFNDKWNVKLEDEAAGKVYIEYNEGVETYILNGDFTHVVTTKLILTDEVGNTYVYDLNVLEDTFELNKKI